MSNENEMNAKYQQHYTKILNGTLTDTIVKSISYQANIQLANEIIAEQEKTIQDLKTGAEEFKKELDAVRNTKAGETNTKIVSLENTLKSNQATISKLQNDLFEANKLRTDYENVKHQVQHLETFRNEVVKLNDRIKNLGIEHQKKIEDYEEKIKLLNEEIIILKTPPTSKKKKVSKVVVSETPEVKIVTNTKAKIVKQSLPGQIVKDGGSF